MKVLKKRFMYVNYKTPVYKNSALLAYLPQFEKVWQLSKIFDVNVKIQVYKQGLYDYLAYIPQIEMTVE